MSEATDKENPAIDQEFETNDWQMTVEEFNECGCMINGD